MDASEQEMVARQLGLALRQARLERAMPIPEAAERCGTTKSQISQIERGSRLPSLTVLLDLCTAYDVLLTELVEDIYPFGSRRRPRRLPAAPVDGRKHRISARTDET